MTQDKRTKFNAQISEEAAAWFVDFRLGDIDAFARREFDAWIRSSPEHLRAYLEIAAIWNEGSSLSAHRDLDSAALIAFAQSDFAPLDAGCAGAQEDADPAGAIALAGTGDRIGEAVAMQRHFGQPVVAAVEAGEVVREPHILHPIDFADVGVQCNRLETARFQTAPAGVQSIQGCILASAKAADDAHMA